MIECRAGLRWRRWAACGALIAVLAGVSGCEGARKQLGLTKNPPDEFTVVTRAPLIVPPDVALRPPEPGVQRPQELEPSKQAQAALFDLDPAAVADRAGAEAQLSSAELAFLTQAGVEGADPNIRDILRRESSPFAVRDENFVDRLMFWREEDELGVVVDAAGEAERLRDNTDAGKSVTEGETPIIIRRRRALLEDIF